MNLSADKKIYTFGYSATVTQTMAGRRAERNAGFFLPHLRAGMQVLDCGRGPASITLGLAEVVAPVDLARSRAAQQGCPNVRFDVGDVLQLPYPVATFDAVVHS